MDKGTNQATVSVISFLLYPLRDERNGCWH